MTKLTPELIHAAIDGYEAQKNRIDQQIADLRGLLSGHSTPAPATAQAASSKGVSKRRKKRRLSAAGREAIAAAARKRWAAFKAAKEAKKKN
jgi:hypothetical protein